MVQVRTFTESGGHATNEDAFLVVAHPLSEGCLLCCLADGQGGRAGGARAAQLACQSVVADAANRRPAELLDPANWPAILRLTDLAVEADREAGFCTLVAFSVVADTITGASCGDSALLVVSGDGSAEELTAGQRKNPPVGSGEAAVTMFAAVLDRPWRVLAMTDGVWKYVGWERVKALTRESSGQSLIETLQEAARLKGSRAFADDFTIVVLEEEEEGH